MATTVMEAPPRARTETPVLSIRGVSKRFGAVQALHDVDFEVHAGEVVALVGDNGAGKSTLVKIIAGIHQPDTGEFYFDGEPVELDSPREAGELGIATVGAARVARVALVAGVGIAATAVFTSDRGMPLPVVILVAFVGFFQYLPARTRFGRHIYAVGGSDGPIPRRGEAARRAGIHVTRVRMTVFVLAGTMAAIGGIVEASRLLAVTQSSGESDLLLFAIAGPVMAGTSLFGGRGSVWSVLLGALVIGSISNGVDLLALPSAVEFMVTGGVLALAVIVDALARRQRQRTGRR